MKADGIALWGRLIAGLMLVVVLSCFANGFEPKGLADDVMPRVIEPNKDRLVSGVLYRVIDGDSIELFVDGRIVAYELAGADAPDLVGEGPARIRGSVAARDQLLAFLEGEQLMLLPDRMRPTDAMGRTRGYVYRMPDGLFVNLEMVRLGLSKHARDPAGFNNEVMLWAQDRARDARKGVWSAPEPEPEVAEPILVEDTLEPEQSPAEVPAVVTKKVEPTAPDSGIVYITKSGTKYHTKDCPHARSSGVARRLDEVKKTHGACKSCDPDGAAVASADD
tara:strand:- start:331 stop:1164 length:834 start_codon:yes stop_codon:yes gene_type:complete